MLSGPFGTNGTLVDKTMEDQTLRTRLVYAQFCDDIRQEHGNKFSFMGCYRDVMIVAQFPTVLAKLCANVTIFTPQDRPFDRLVVRAKLNDEVAAELEMPVSSWREQFEQKAGTSELGRISAQAMIVLSPLGIMEPSKLCIEAETESGIIRGSALSIRLRSSEDTAVQFMGGAE